MHARGRGSEGNEGNEFVGGGAVARKSAARARVQACVCVCARQEACRERRGRVGAERDAAEVGALMATSQKGD